MAEVAAAPASESECLQAAADDVAVDAGAGAVDAAVMAELEALRAENKELSIRVLELQEAAVIDEADMESAVAEMEAVIEDMADKLGAAEAQLETERREFSTRLQMLALESADQELMRRERMEGMQEKQNAAVHPLPEAGQDGPAPDAGAGAGAGAKDAAAEAFRLRQRVAELEAELQSLRLARQPSDVRTEPKSTNPFLSDAADFDGGAAPAAERANGDAPVPLSRTVTPRTAHLRGVLGRTMNELKERRAERARAAAERAAERLVMQSAATASANGDYHFSDLTASAALTALSPDKKFVRPDDEKVVGMLEKAERRRSMSGSEPPMRRWADQPVDVIRNELIRRGVREHQGVYEKGALLALLQH